MSNERSAAKELLQNIWQVQGDTIPVSDEDCSPTKACKNVQDMNFDGFADEGMDLRSAWRERLARESVRLRVDGIEQCLLTGQHAAERHMERTAGHAGIARISLALALFRDGMRTYWIGYRQNFSSGTLTTNGAYVVWGFNNNQQSMMLDLQTPGTSARH